MEERSCHTCARRSHDHPDYCDLGHTDHHTDHCAGYEPAVFRARALKKVLDEQLPESTRHLELRDSKDIPIGNIERQDVEDPLVCIREMAGVSPARQELIVPDSSSRVVVVFDRGEGGYSRIVVMRRPDDGGEREMIATFSDFQEARAWCLHCGHEGVEFQYSDLDIEPMEGSDELCQQESWNNRVDMSQVDVSPLADGINNEINNQIVEEIVDRAGEEMANEAILEQVENITDEEIHDDFAGITQERGEHRIGGIGLQGHTNPQVGSIRTGMVQIYAYGTMQMPFEENIRAVSLQIHPEDLNQYPNVLVYVGDRERQDWPLGADPITIPLCHGNLGTLWLRTEHGNMRVQYMAQVMIEGD